MRTHKNETYCIAVDMGAGSIRIMLGCIGRDAISYQEIHRTAKEIVVVDGHDRWNLEQIVREIRLGIARAIECSESPPSSIGVDSWGVDFVLLDEKGDLLETPVAYRDKRTAGMQELWETMMSGTETFRRTGINFYMFNTLFQLLSLKESELLKRSSKLLFIPSYINYILSGKQKNELSISSTSQLMEAEGEDWDSVILGKLGLEPSLLGEVIVPGTKLGPVILPEASGTVMESIAVCGHDTACAVAAIPVENPNFAYISAGTWCVLGIESDRPILGMEALELGLTNERGFDHTYRILKNIAGLWLMQGLKKHLPDNISFGEMEQMTREAGSVDQVIDPDHPGFYHPEDMKEAFDLYFLKTGQVVPTRFGEYLRCAYDSLCFSFRYHIEKLEELSGRPIEVLHVIGGGSQSDYLNQHIATLCRRKVVSGPVEGATLGNLLIQAIKLGRIRDLDEGRQLVKKSFPGVVYSPDNKYSHLNKRYDIFLQLKNL